MTAVVAVDGLIGDHRHVGASQRSAVHGAGNGLSTTVATLK